MKVVIVGGVAGGASAAARLRRLDENIEIVMFEKGGKQVLWPKKNFEAGSWSKVFNIEGGKKAIKKVVIYYSKKNPEDEESVVELWGRQK